MASIAETKKEADGTPLGHLNKGHSQNFQNGKGQSIVMHEKLRDRFIGDSKGLSSKNQSCVQF